MGCCARESLKKSMEKNSGIIFLGVVGVIDRFSFSIFFELVSKYRKSDENGNNTIIVFRNVLLKKKIANSFRAVYKETIA